jgi:hypothetical protein
LTGGGIMDHPSDAARDALARLRGKLDQEAWIRLSHLPRAGAYSITM